MNIYEFTSYIEVLNLKISDMKMLHSDITLAQLARHCLLQPSYLTNVLKERVDLNSDQLFRLCEILQFDQNEIDYLHLLLEYKKTSYIKRKKLLENKIAKIRQNNLRTEKTISIKNAELNEDQLQLYYLDPYIQLIHIYIGSLKGKCQLSDILKDFSISTLHAINIIQTLEKLKYIKSKNNGFEILVEGHHLSRDSHLARPHQALMRLKSLDQIQKLAPDETYLFSATISTIPEVRTQIQAEFLKFLKSAEKLVKNHDSQNLYQINFDLFPWVIRDTL